VRIVLLALDREPERAEKNLRARYRHAEIAILPLAKVESGSARQRLRTLRSFRPDIFAVATERLAWQQGQNALLLFGALGGARTMLLFDAHGGRREEARSGVLARAPLRFAHEAWASWAVVRRARRELARLERAVEQNLEGERVHSSTTKGNTLGERRRLAVSPPINPLPEGGEENRRRTLEKESPEVPLMVAPRITYLRTTPAAGTQSGGATTHTLGFINAAVELGAQLSVITNDRIAGLDEAKVSVKSINPDSLGLTRPAFDLRNGLLFTDQACAEIARQPPDFIYQRYSRVNLSGVGASLSTRRPLFLEYNGSEVWMARHWGRLRLADLLERCERLNLAAASRVFVVAEVERNNLVEAGVAADKIVVNPNGVDVEKFRPDVGGAAVRRELGVTEDEMLAGFVGTFGPWHGVRTLAEAITLMPVDCRVRFLLVGSGMLRDEAERVIREAGREKQVIFTGQVDHDQVPALLDACDILLSPHVPLEDGSEFFGSPTKLFEYMAMGKGIVASRLGQIGEVLEDQETALLTEPGNARQLADAIFQLSRSPELRERLGAAARQAAIERHTWKRNAARVLDAYHKWVKTS
jgi:glycosyltransferase involved in cell wall biosynthesis